jgi:hypothetical protein
VHNAKNPAGEIRGQIGRQAASRTDESSDRSAGAARRATIGQSRIDDPSASSATRSGEHALLHGTRSSRSDRVHERPMIDPHRANEPLSTHVHQEVVALTGQYGAMEMMLATGLMLFAGIGKRRLELRRPKQRQWKRRSDSRPRRRTTRLT